MKQLTRINFQNIQAAQITQYQKNKQPNKKVGKRAKQTFLQFLRAVFTFAGYKIHFYIPFQHFEDIIPLSSDPHSL